MKLKRISDLQSSKIPIVAGVVNISPESFFSGSIALKENTILDKIRSFVNEGAKVIDLGAMSTRPVSLYGGKEITVIEERERFESIIDKIIQLCFDIDVALSIDTQSSEIVELVLEKGVTVINDISGLVSDKKIASLVSKYNSDIILMACKEKPGDPKSFEETYSALQNSIKIAKEHNIGDERIFVDPGFGGWQGRPSNVDLELIKNYPHFHKMGYPLYIGVSRKSTIKTLEGGENPEDRLIGSIVLTNYLARLGASVIRTHDVKDTILGLKTQANILQL